MIKLSAASVLAAALLLSACAPHVIVKHWPAAGTHLRVAVLPFKPKAAYPESGAIAYEAFSTAILAVKDYDVVDRGALEEVLKEQKLSLSGAVDQTTAIAIGKLLGADAIILGAVTEFTPRNYLMFPPAEVAMTARLINVKTSEIEWSADYEVGGMKRWLTWVIWPIGAVATAISPSAETELQRAARRICNSLQEKGPASRT